MKYLWLLLFALGLAGCVGCEDIIVTHEDWNEAQSRCEKNGGVVKINTFSKQFFCADGLTGIIGNLKK